MLNVKDINQLKAVLATKQDLKKMQADNLKVFATKKDLEKMADNSLKIFATKTDIREIKEDLSILKELVQGLIVATDSIAKSVDKLVAEYAAISTQLSRHDRWIKQIAEKVGLHLVTE
jgi:hypothetical protein